MVCDQLSLALVAKKLVTSDSDSINSSLLNSYMA